MLPKLAPHVARAERERAILQLATRQFGVFASWQLAKLGIGRRVASDRVARNRWHHVHRGVYALVPHRLLTRRGRILASVLACGPDAVSSHHDAGWLHGVLQHARSRFQVTVPARTGRARRPTVQLHRSSTLRAADVTVVDGIPCTTVARTVFDLAEVMTDRQLERLLDQVERRDLLHVPALQEQIAHHRGRTAAQARLTRVLASHLPGTTATDSELEERMLALLRGLELPAPQAQMWIDLDDGEPMIRADFAWPEAKVMIETDGQQDHGRRRRAVTDYRRDQRAIRAGWLTIRVTWDQITKEPVRLGATITEVVRSRWPAD